MSKHKTIVLIDVGDEITWCDSVPSHDIQKEDVTEYILLSEYNELKSRCSGWLDMQSNNSLLKISELKAQVTRLEEAVDTAKKTKGWDGIDHTLHKAIDAIFNILKESPARSLELHIVDVAKEAYLAGYYEGAGDDVWYRDHAGEESKLSKYAFVHKPLDEYLQHLRNSVKES